MSPHRDKDTVQSTLVEPPPEAEGLDEESVEFVRADSVRELAEKTNIGDENVLDRVLLPGRQFGPYHILGFVAAGGMGEIYAAKRIMPDGTQSRPVALKVISDEFSDDWKIIERFKREARISKAIRSRHVARVYEFGESPQGHVFLSMELLNGEELFDRLHRHRVLSAMTVAELSLQILKGLHKIHKSGFVHRDLKPENIYLAQDPATDTEEIKIIDFGVAKRADEKSDPLLSVVGQIYGTPQYIAPEQAVNPDVDQRADLYSLGVVLYECVTGSLPFQGESSYDLIVAHQQREVPRLPSSIDPAFADIIYRAMAKDPDERFQSAVEMGRVIKRWLDETSWSETTDPDPILTGPTTPRDGHLAAPSVERRDRDGGFDVDEAAARLRTRADTDNAATRVDTRLDDPALDAPPMLTGGSRTGDEDEAPPNLQNPVSEQSDSKEQQGSEQTTPQQATPGDNSDDDIVGIDEPSSVESLQAPQTAPDTNDSTKNGDAAAASSPSLSPADNPAADKPESDSAADEQTGELSPPSGITTELRNPRAQRADHNGDETDGRAAQIITGVALGLLILAILWAALL